ncbi:PAAR domain-containing protein [Pokkaliibacter sp. MBI-7]|uniref:PAAR domain-containing protein n=1 Tax=Pokkaliibacter sp. MBI-7 TaxID=3040600 RepID=UPI00244B034F|nr:PAAR domain-containing protein [Pokkaliibacter sp. MBI-7]MDH2432940.1 PAAR domain-containing protein [Pokkaliibacter sp. MBI-7]
MGKPAATISHNHTCPAKRGKTPHVGGPIISGSGNVFIGGLPAARVGDNLICNAPPDTINEGSSTVFINGKPAARMGDSTEHGGVIVQGNATVFIGDKSYSSSGGTPPEESKIVEMARRDLSRIQYCQRNGQTQICNDPVCPCRKNGH